VQRAPSSSSGRARMGAALRWRAAARVAVVLLRHVRAGATPAGQAEGEAEAEGGVEAPPWPGSGRRDAAFPAALAA
jgi:hypothetical protein